MLPLRRYNHCSKIIISGISCSSSCFKDVFKTASLKLRLTSKLVHKITYLCVKRLYAHKMRPVERAIQDENMV